MKHSWLFFFCALAGLGMASEIPQASFPNGVGVNIHFVTGHQRDLDAIAGAGFKWIRMDFGWEGIERKPGEYDWSGYGELLGNLERRGLRALFILDYSNPLYEQTVTSPNPMNHQPHKTTASPQQPESIAAYARWAAAAAKHFHGRPVVWEIWNEPNIQFWSPKPDVKQYLAMALAAGKAIRQAEPTATLVGPATSGFPWEFLESCFQGGLLQYLDAVSVHPYRDPKSPPETAAADYRKLRQLIDRYAPAGRAGRLPILSGEWGYSSFSRGVSLERQAAFITRQQLANALAGVPLSIWYDWKNDGTDPNENEHNFGTVLPDLSPKPAYLAIQTLTHELSGYAVGQRVEIGGDQDYLLQCIDSKGLRKLVAWTTGSPHSLALELDKANPAEITAKNYLGAQSDLKVEGKRLMLTLDSGPQYIMLGQGSVSLP
jgi:polysaccharide biosynthesis protein PslG